METAVGTGRKHLSQGFVSQRVGASLIFLCLSAQWCAATTFTAPTLITESDITYEGQDIVIDGTTVIIDGPHTFKSILLTNGAVLSHSPCTVTLTHKLDLTVTNVIVVSTNSRIDVSGKGYLAGRTTANTTVGGAGVFSGGSYGGLSGDGTVKPYGDYANPADWGSGGGGASGGGLVRLSCKTLVLDGQLLASGSDSGGGSGGGICVNTETMLGSGRTEVKGGSGVGRAGGGGGRVAIYAADYAGFKVSAISASGAVSSGGASYPPSGAGTIYLRDTDEPGGLLIIRNGPRVGQGVTRFPPASTNSFQVPDILVVDGPETQLRIEDPSLVRSFERGLIITNSGYVLVQGDVHFGPSLRLELNTGGRLEVSGRLTSEIPLSLTTSGGLIVHGAFDTVLPLSLTAGATFQVFGAITSSIPLAVNGGVLSADLIAAPSLLVTNGGTLTCPSSTSTEMHKLEIFVPGSLVVSNNSFIDVNRKGYAEGYTTGNKPTGALTGCSYGGLGGGTTNNPTYGDFADPDDWGTGGHFNIEAGRSGGGGLTRIHVGEFRLDGVIWASGGAESSGGGIFVDADTLSGTGSITAQGGQGGFCGGGGRVAVYARDLSDFNTNRISAPAGGPPPFGPPAQAGTVHVVQGGYHTHIRTTIPAGSNGGYCSNTFDRLILISNKPLDTNALSLDKLLITGPIGDLAPSSLIELSDRAYQVTFPPLTEDGRYHFTLSSTVTDVEGFRLDQNANGVPGELLEDAYNLTLIVDRVRPRITQHAPAGDIAGTISFVDVWFSEPADTNSFSVSDISIFNPTNGSVMPTSVRQIGLTRFRIAFPPQTLTGLYHLLVGTNITDLASNPILTGYEGSFNVVPVDLELTGITASTNLLVAGDQAALSWQGRNHSGAPLLGSWLDAVYLSPDPSWNITDLLLGTIQHTGGLASDEVYSASLTFNVPGLLPGNYYLIVRTDIGNQARETVETNNSAVFGPIATTVRQLLVGGSWSGTLTPGNRLHYFAMTVPDGQSLRLTLEGQSGVNHLFVNYASTPTRLNSDFSATGANSDQTITLTGIQGGGTYYVLIAGEQVGPNGAYRLAADAASFFLTGFTPTHLVGDASDRFWVPILQSNLPAATLTGAGFQENTAVEFVNSNGVAFIPLRKELVSPSLMRLVLPAERWSAGVYNIRVTQGPLTRVLTNAVTVTTGGEAKLEARIAGTELRIGGGQTLWVEYANVGTRPMPAPLLKVTAYTNAVIVTHKLNRRPQDRLNPPPPPSGGGPSGGGVWPTAPAFRFRVSVPLYTVQAMAIGSGSNPGILQPGERGRVPVIFDGLLRDLDEQSIQFSVGSLTADDTLIADCGSPGPGLPNEYQFPRTGIKALAPAIYATNLCPQSLFSPNWAQLEETSAPETVDRAGWRAVWGNLTNSAGPLWADYVLMLGDNMNHFAKFGQITNDPAALFNFEVLQASAALNPVTRLASVVDASAPSSGFPLVFGRVYRQPILSRYKLGPLGRGWTHNWDISVQSLEQFSGVVVHGPNGQDRFFGRYKDGSYTATGSDSGSLILTNGNFRLTEADGTVWQFGGHNLQNVLDYIQDPNGNRVTCGYSGTQLTSLVHTSGRQILLQYNGAGRLSQITDPVGPGDDDDRITTYEYDTSGEHLTRVTAPGDRVTTYAYHTTGIPQRLHALINVTHPDLTQDSFEYDSRGRLAQTSQNCCGSAQQVRYAYDSAGTVTVTDASGRTTQLLYGPGGQIAQVRDGEGRIVNFRYDENLRLTELLGAGGERYRYGYGGAMNLTAIEDPLHQISNFAYEPNFNRLAQVRDARGNGLQYAYDTRGNLTGITYADATAERYAYDARGNVITCTNRRGGVIIYTYNSAGQLTSKDYAGTPGITDFTYAYDSAGNLTNATYWNPQLATHETLNLQYQPFTDRLTRLEYPGGRFFTFGYDAARRRTRRADQDGHVTAYLYDALGRLARMTNELGQTIVIYEYDLAGRLSRKTLGNGVFSTYAYNNAGQVAQLVNSRTDGNVLSSFAYTYDASGRRASMTTQFKYPLPPGGEGQGEGAFTYGYDPLGQSTSVTHPNGRLVTYGYDPTGNRTQVADNGMPTAYLANHLNQYTSVGGTDYLFDADGNLTNHLSTSYTYDPENRLIGVTTPADTWTYTYDAFGNRIAATHNGQTKRYVIDPTGLGNVAAEYDGGGSLIARYEHGFGLLVRSDAAGASAFYTFSAIGHTSELTDPAGTVANSYAYDPFGLSLGKNETISNPFEFVGEFGVMNEENGLEFMRQRLYDSKLGRFIQADPWGIKGGLNLYAYVKNRPVMGVDPTGLWFQVVPEKRSFLDDLRQRSESIEDSGQERFGDSIEKYNDVAKNIERSAFNYQMELLFKMFTEFLPHKIEVPLESLLLHHEYHEYLQPPDPDPTHKEDDESSGLFRSGDPNGKLWPSGYGSEGYLPAGGVMAYQIRFENQPGATAPAQRVTVTDTLDPNLDLSTFELTEIAFANQIITVPAGLNHYETRLAFTVTNQTLTLLGDEITFASSSTPSNSLVIEVNGQLDMSNRLLELSLTSWDPLTGWYPEDALAGLLYPNDESHRGEGSLSYVVRPKLGLPSGTKITNRANIVFDYNDAILTPLVSNALDGAPPTSSVTPLPAEAGPAILVQWSGQDDAGGSGLASYDVYVTADSTNHFRWLERTTATSAWWIGTRGSSYSFYSVARDNVGQEESVAPTPDATVFVPPNAPLLSDITNRVADVGTLLAITNTVSGSPVGRFVFSLDAPSPFGASINPTNGVLRWTPNCNQASRTNTLTVIVTDSGNPNLQDFRTFQVVTRECVVPELGRIVVPAGGSSSVPVNLISSVPLTNLLMTVETDTNRLINLLLEPIVPEICSNALTFIGTNRAAPEDAFDPADLFPGRGRYLLSFTTCPNTSLIGTQQIAWLHFTAAAGQSSAFVNLNLGNGVGLQPDGTEVRNFAPQSGRVVVVGAEPLLEAVLSTNRQPNLILYAQPGRDYAIEGKPRLDISLPWQAVWQGTQTNLFQHIEPISGTDRAMFFRAHR